MIIKMGQPVTAVNVQPICRPAFYRITFSCGHAATFPAHFGYHHLRRFRCTYCPEGAQREGTVRGHYETEQDPQPDTESAAAADQDQEPDPAYKTLSLVCTPDVGGPVTFGDVCTARTLSILAVCDGHRAARDELARIAAGGFPGELFILDTISYEPQGE